MRFTGGTKEFALTTMVSKCSGSIVKGAGREDSTLISDSRGTIRYSILASKEYTSWKSHKGCIE